MSAPTLDLKEKLTLDFQAFEQSLNGQSKSPIHATRKQAITRFAELGFPTVRHEEWKYTNVMPAVRHDYAVLTAPSTPSQTLAQTLSKADVEPFLIPAMNAQNANVVVVVNGVFAAELSSIKAQSGLEVMSFAEALQHHASGVEQHFAHYARFDNDAFVALNTAFARDGVFMRVAKGTVVEKPLHLVFVSDCRQKSVLAQPRCLFVLGDGAEATVVESYHSIGANAATPAFVSVVGEAVLGANAVFHHNKIQNDSEHSTFIGTLQAHQAASSVFNSVVVTLSGGLVRNNLNTTLAASGTDTHYYGLTLVGGKTLADNHTFVDHAMPHCTSNELYKTILDERSTGVFNGKILVRQDAQKTLAYQSNRNILLSKDATMNNKPQLEIFADDVKCSHGAATGQLDEEPMFYLQARGIGKDQARAMLLYAFAGEIVEKISNEALRKHIERIVAERLHQELDFS
jgi:Fe-S cluster assembly protein SufD